VRLTREYLPQVHGDAFDNPRVELIIGDAADFVAGAQEMFDLVVFDLTPPDSPAAGLYAPAFYEQLKRVMNPDAALSMHLGAPFFHGARVAALFEDLRKAFPIWLVMDDGDGQRHARPCGAFPRRTQRTSRRPSDYRPRVVRRRRPCRTLLGISGGAR
jgi:hypothetical protein